MIVSNTTPISNLLHIDKISVLNKLFGAVYIPKAVADEVNVVFSSYKEWQECLEREQIIIQPTLNTIFVKQLIDKLRSEHHFWIREDMYQRVLHIAKEKT